MPTKPSPHSIIERIAESPAKALDSAVTKSEKIVKDLDHQPAIKETKYYLDTLGPGIITGAADDDPSGIATYSQTGSQYGYQLLWLSLFTFPLMAVVQEMCARIGLVTGRGLAGNIRIHYPRWVLYLCAALLFVANTLNLGADLGAMAKALQLLAPHVSFTLIVLLFTFFSLALQIYVPYAQYSKYLKFLVIVLFSYVISAFSIKLDWGQVLKSTFIPSLTFSKDQIFLICGILGTTISPYLFFWQTSQEVEEGIMKGQTTLKDRRGSSHAEIKRMRIDVWSGMFVSNIVMFFIIVTTAATLHAHGILQVSTAAEAAKALRPFGGDLTYLLFACGIIGTGLLAIPILAGSASYAFAESFKWKEGLYRKLKDAPSFYGVIMISMIIGLILNFVGIDPIKALIYSAVLNGIVAPLILGLIVLISSNPKIMEHRANHPAVTIIGWAVTGIMTVSGIAAIIALILG